MHFGVVSLETVFEATVLWCEVDPLRQHGVPLRTGFAGQHLHTGVAELGDVKQRPVARLARQRFVWRTGEAGGTQRAEQHSAVVEHGEAHERVRHEAVRHHLLEVLANFLLARRRVGGQALPALLGVHDEEAAGERAAIQVAPDHGDAGVLVVVEHAVQVVHRRVLRRVVVVRRVVAAVAQLTHADHRDAPAQLNVGQVPRQVDDHAAAGTASHAECHHHHRGQRGLLDLVDEIAQRMVHRPIAGVVGVGIDALRHSSRKVIAGCGQLVLVRHIGLEIRVPVVARILQFEPLAGAVHALEELVLGRDRQGDRLVLEAL